ncbi:Uncharacterised protein [Kingella potus]|uniref:Uncharacterized protein n=1 Tax=Kingella potus TaxID=265175 RepID=A0A377QYX6_9NEIS|nr:hypothetical protein [Kingella potus]UOP01750.1 hypothetical protein LVJ84_06455 [Kingella potus]STQ99940.1 Uncharacterised protein [Kingella potus]
MEVSKFMIFSGLTISVFSIIVTIALIYFGCKIAMQYEKEKKAEKAKDQQIKLDMLAALQKLAEQKEKGQGGNT